MTFSEEFEFESAVIHELTQRGWESEIIKNPSAADFLNNWATMLFAL